MTPHTGSPKALRGNARLIVADMRIAIGLLLITLIFSRLSAQTKTAATTEAVDFSSPRAALTGAYLALKNGDIDAAKSCLIFKDAAEAEIFDITRTQLYRPMKLMHAMEARFGPAGRRPFANAPLEKSLDDLLEKVRAADIQVTGDRRDRRQESRRRSVRGKRVDRHPLSKHKRPVKIVASTFCDAGGGSAGLPANQLQFMRALRDSTVAACQATEAGLARGDFKSADEAFADYQSRMARGVKAAAAPATQKQR